MLSSSSYSPSADDITQCDKVDEDDAFKRCEECLVTYYCSRECQKADWKTGNHQVSCKEVRRCRSGE